MQEIDYGSVPVAPLNTSIIALLCAQNIFRDRASALFLLPSPPFVSQLFSSKETETSLVYR